ncbi:hypothetical protein BASA61_006214 [Batrachochytrium salamandrivorans]|nr:hypothetical protein BASA61_006214 [Batrachochytrium salamandrivorans]
MTINSIPTTGTTSIPTTRSSKRKSIPTTGTTTTIPTNTNTETLDNQTPLLFNERLEPTSITKPIPVTDLVRRLQDLHSELKHLDNTGSAPHTSVTVVCARLVSRSLLQHKERGVRILTACCLAELLRLHAPTVPFTTVQLRAVFGLFFQQLPNVTDSKHTYFSLCYELLECLNSAKTVTLVSELNADELTVCFFDTLFKSVRPEMSQSVIACLLDLLQQLIDDSQFLHHDIIDTLLLQLRSAQKIASPIAYQMACELSQACADKLQRYVCQYFSDILIATGKDVTEDTDPEQFRSAHKLILEVYKAAPDTLLSVIPQLEEELKVDTLPLRTLALTSLGEMFLQSGSHLISIYPQVWKAWCDRRNDKAVAMRNEWLKYSVWIICKHPLIFTELHAFIQQKLLDPDERVRIEAIKALGAIWTEIPSLICQKSLKSLTLRCRDKKCPVRTEAIDTVARLFNHLMSAFTKCEAADVDKPIALESFIWIAGDILELLYVSDAEITALVEKVFYLYILPALPDPMNHMRRTVVVLHHLSEKQYKGFINLLSRKSVGIYQTNIFLMQCQKFNGGIMDNDEENITRGLGVVITHLSQLFPDPKKAQAALHKFSQINDRHMYHLIRTIMNPQSEYKKIVRDHKDVSKRILQHGVQIADTIGVLLRRVSLVSVGRSSAECLMQLIQRIRHGEEAEFMLTMEVTAKLFMKDISVNFPAVYKTLTQSFVDCIISDSNSSSVGDALAALSRYIRTFPDESPKEPVATARLRQLALGDNPEQAKNAMIVLALGEHDDICREIVSTLVENLSLENEDLVSKLACLQAAARYAYSSSFITSVVPIMNFIIKEVLLVNHVEAAEDAPDWIDYVNLDMEGKIKIMSLKLAVKPLLYMDSENEDESKLDLAKSVIKMLRMILDNSGEAATKGFPTSPTYKTHLRLTAGLCMLKLTRNKILRAMLDPMDLRRMSLLVQDPVYHVRNNFIIKLCACIQSTQAPSEYIIMLFFIAHEPDVTLKNQVRGFVTRRAKQIRNCDDTSQAPLVENTFGSFLHLASHHPDFSASQDDLESSEGYARFFLDTVATAENIALLYSIATKIKTVKDKHSSDSEGLYIMGEMAQILIHDRTSSNSWTLQSWQGRLPISGRLFEHLSSKEASTNMKRQFLGQTYLKERIQRSRTPVKRSVGDVSFRAREGHSSPISTPSRQPDAKRRKNISPMTANGDDDADDTVQSSWVDKDHTQSSKKKRFPMHSLNSASSNTSLESSTPLRRSSRKSNMMGVSMAEMSDSDVYADDDDVMINKSHLGMSEQENISHLSYNTMPYVDLKSNGEHPRASTRSLGAKQDGRTSDGDGSGGIKKQQNVLERMMAAAAAKGKTQSDVLVNVSSSSVGSETIHHGIDDDDGKEELSSSPPILSNMVVPDKPLLGKRSTRAHSRQQLN